LGRREYNIFIPGSEIERYSERALKLTRREVLIDWLVATKPSNRESIAGRFSGW